MTTSTNGIPTGSGQGSRRLWAKKAGLVGGGLLVGGILAGTVSATAASNSSPSTTPSAGTSTQQEGYGAGHRGMALGLSGTVTAVSSNSVTIKTASGAKTYGVTSTSDIDKNGEATLSKLAVGDAVRFSTTTSGGTTIDKLHAGDEARDMPQGFHGGRMGHRLGQSGTVTAVDGTSVTIKTASGTTKYAVSSASDIDKNGEAAVKDLVVGDAVRFSTTTTSGTATIDKLHAGDEAKNMPQGMPGMGAPHGYGTNG